MTQPCIGALRTCYSVAGGQLPRPSHPTRKHSPMTRSQSAGRIQISRGTSPSARLRSRSSLFLAAAASLTGEALVLLLDFIGFYIFKGNICD